MIRVVFHDVGEFLAELDRDSERRETGSLVDDRRVARGIVRLTNYLSRPQLMPYSNVHVFASYMLERREASRWHAADLVELHEYAGQLWPSDQLIVNEKTQTRQAAIREAIEQACERLELTIRGGKHEAVA